MIKSFRTLYISSLVKTMKDYFTIDKHQIIENQKSDSSENQITFTWLSQRSLIDWPWFFFNRKVCLFKKFETFFFCSKIIISLRCWMIRSLKQTKFRTKKNEKLLILKMLISSCPYETRIHFSYKVVRIIIIISHYNNWWFDFLNVFWKYKNPPLVCVKLMNIDQFFSPATATT